jgi:hypothetical protein
VCVRRGCKTVLSVYNPDDYCGVHLGAAEVAYQEHMMIRYIDRHGVQRPGWAPPKKSEGRILADLKRHGTLYGYRRGCRCDACSKAKRDADARRNAARRGK